MLYLPVKERLLAKILKLHTSIIEMAILNLVALHDGGRDTKSGYIPDTLFSLTLSMHGLGIYQLNLHMGQNLCCGFNLIEPEFCTGTC